MSNLARVARRRARNGPELRPPDRRRLRFLLFLLAVVPFLNGLPNDFTYDDLPVVRDDPRLAGPSRAGELLTTGYWGDSSDVYRPLVLLTYAVQRWVHGPSPAAFRAVNVLLHAGVALLLLELFLALGFRERSCAVATALFAVMPIHAEAVTSVVGRAEVLAAGLSLLSALAYLRASREAAGRLRWGALSVVAFGLALLSKESAAALPAILLVVELFRDEPSLRPGRRARVATVAGLGALLVGGFLGLRLVVLGGALRAPTALPTELTNPVASLPPALRVLNGSDLLWLYAAKCAVPYRLSADYSSAAIPVLRELGRPRAWVGLLAWTAIVVGALRLRRTWPEAAFGPLYFLSAFLVTANVAFPIGVAFAERLAYLPSAGVALTLGAVLDRAGTALASRTARPRSGLLPAVAVVIGLLPLTLLRNRDWKDDRTLYESVVRAQPRSARGHYLLAFDSYRRGDLPSAETSLGRALGLHRRFPNAWDLLGEVLWRQGRYREAIEAQRTNVELFPDSVDARLYLALWTARTGRANEARRILEEGAARFPSRKEFRRALDELGGAPLAR